MDPGHKVMNKTAPTLVVLELMFQLVEMGQGVLGPVPSKDMSKGCWLWRSISLRDLHGRRTFWRESSDNTLNMEAAGS